MASVLLKLLPRNMSIAFDFLAIINKLTFPSISYSNDLVLELV